MTQCLRIQTWSSVKAALAMSMHCNCKRPRQHRRQHGYILCRRSPVYGAHVFDPRLAPQLLSHSDRGGKLLRRHAIPIIGAARELVTLDQLHAAVRSSTERPLIIHIFAPLSQPCQNVLPKIEAAVRATRGSVDLVSLNVNNKGALSQWHAISGWKVDGGHQAAYTPNCGVQLSRYRSNRSCLQDCAARWRASM